MSILRINKFLSQAGVCSRRNADQLLQSGRVRINGLVVRELGVKIDTNTDVVLVDDKEITLVADKIYLILNKPCGVISSNKDQFGRKTVVDFVKNYNTRLFHVGRLDYDSSGLIILTNDGEISNRLMHPRNKIIKQYIATIQGLLTKKEIEEFQTGVEIDGRLTAHSKIKIITEYKDKTKVQIDIHEGRNRQIRKMCEALGHPVIELKRIAIGEIKLYDLEEGKTRLLNPEEIKYLFAL
jgi:pseudouridine synthase